MKEGFIPWNKPWNTDANGNADLPKNLKSKKAYRGINVWLLGMSGFSSPWWLTFNQAKSMGGMVKKGSKSTKVYFWQFIKKQAKDANGTPKTLNGLPVVTSFPVLRVYSVFNLDQIEGIEAPKAEELPVKTPAQKIEVCENIVSGYKNAPSFSFGGNRACYSPVFDSITLPKFEQFNNGEEYYSTLFHEIIHSTGHKNRLNREGVINHTGFGSHLYSKEELVAEFGASFLCGVSGIENKTIDNSVGYLQSWISRLQNDPSLLVSSASQAQKACDLVLGVSYKDDETED